MLLGRAEERLALTAQNTPNSTSITTKIITISDSPMFILTPF